MPVEIREIVIKTLIQSEGFQRREALNEKQGIQLKREVLEECRRMIAENRKKGQIKR